MNEAEFKKDKDLLSREIKSMLTDGNSIYKDKTLNDQKYAESKFMSKFSAWKDQRALNKRQQEFEVNCMIIESKFDRLNQISQYKLKVEPLRYTCNFILGVLTAIVGLVIFIHLWVAGTLRNDGRQLDPYLNTMLESIYGTSNWSFMSILVFLFFGYYLLLATMQGNIKFGLRFFSLNFYPLVPGETFVNSFMVNALMMNIYMYSLTYWIVDIFRFYLRGTQAAIFFQVIAKNQ
jgi:hypothetical protein